MSHKYVTAIFGLFLMNITLYGVSTEEFKNAVENGEIEMVRQMLNREHNLLETIFSEVGETAMHIAAQQGHLGIVVLLSHFNMSYSHRDDHGETALHKAAQNGHLEVIQFLLSKDSSLIGVSDYHGATPLFRAVEYGYEGAVSLLLDAGALVTIVDRTTDSTMLEMAAQKGYLRIFGSLFSRIRSQTVSNQQALFSLFFHAIKEKNEEIVRFLIDQRVDINVKDAAERTPLHIAAFSGDTGLIRLLLDNGALPNAPDVYTRTPLDIALTCQNNSIVQLLRQASPVDETPPQNAPRGRETVAQRMGRLIACCCRSCR